MSTTINILCVIDAESLASAVSAGKLKPGKPAKPTPLGAHDVSGVYVYMITESDYVVNSQATPELTISAQVGDSVRWTIANPACEDYSCILYKFDAPKGSNLLSAPVYIPLNVEQAVNKTTSPAVPVFTPALDSTWYSVVMASGNVQYNWSFQLYDASQKLVGCFSWDPFIVIQG